MIRALAAAGGKTGRSGSIVAALPAAWRFSAPQLPGLELGAKGGGLASAASKYVRTPSKTTGTLEVAAGVGSSRGSVAWVGSAAAAMGFSCPAEEMPGAAVSEAPRAGLGKTECAHIAAPAAAAWAAGGAIPVVSGPALGLDGKLAEKAEAFLGIPHGGGVKMQRGAAGAAAVADLQVYAVAWATQFPAAARMLSTAGEEAGSAAAAAWVPGAGAEEASFAAAAAWAPSAVPITSCPARALNGQLAAAEGGYIIVFAKQEEEQASRGAVLEAVETKLDTSGTGSAGRAGGSGGGGRDGGGGGGGWGGGDDEDGKKKRSRRGRKTSFSEAQLLEIKRITLRVARKVEACILLINRKASEITKSHRRLANEVICVPFVLIGVYVGLIGVGYIAINVGVPYMMRIIAEEMAKSFGNISMQDIDLFIDHVMKKIVDSIWSSLSLKRLIFGSKKK